MAVAANGLVVGSRWSCASARCYSVLAAVARTPLPAAMRQLPHGCTHASAEQQR